VDFLPKPSGSSRRVEPARLALRIHPTDALKEA
jgi:hypothetical protein